MHNRLSKKILIAVLSAAMVLSTPFAMINYSRVIAYADDEKQISGNGSIEKSSEGLIITINLDTDVKYGELFSGGPAHDENSLSAALKININSGIYGAISQQPDEASIISNNIIKIKLNDISVLKSYDGITVTYDNSKIKVLVTNDSYKKPIATTVFNIENRIAPVVSGSGIISGSVANEDNADGKTVITLGVGNGINLLDKPTSNTFAGAFTVTGTGVNGLSVSSALVSNNKIVLKLNKKLKYKEVKGGLTVKYTAAAGAYINIKDDSTDTCIKSTDGVGYSIGLSDIKIKAKYPIIDSVVSLKSDDSPAGQDDEVKSIKVTLAEAPEEDIDRSNFEITVKDNNANKRITLGNIAVVPGSGNRSYSIPVSNIKDKAEVTIKLKAKSPYDQDGDTKNVTVHKVLTAEEKKELAKKRLDQKIKDADKLMKSVKKSDAKAETVENGVRFASTKAHTDLSKAIEKATAASADQQAVIITYDNARGELEAAINAFNGAVKIGTKVSAGSSSSASIAPIGNSAGTNTASKDDNKADTKDAKKENKTADIDQEDKKSVDTTENAKVSADVKVSGDKAAAKISKNTLERAVYNVDGKLTINCDTKKATNVEVSLSKRNLSAIANSGVKRVELKSNLGTVSTSRSTVAKIAMATKGDVVIAIIKGSNGYDIKLSADGKEVKTDERFTVNVKASKGQKVYIIDKNGKQKPVRSSYDTKTGTIKVNLNGNTKFVVR